jgi:Uma2 family endonuclease
MEQVQTHEQTRAFQQRAGEQRIPMSYDEYLATFDDSTHAEWVDGEAIVFMPPNTRHQRIVSFLHLLIGSFLHIFGYGELFEAPYAMCMQPNGNVREPDLLFVAVEHADRVGERRLEGPADLIIEVVSTESVARDRSDKFYEYQAGGVREYWIIDPRPGVARADFWVLDDEGRYQPVPIDADGIYHATVLPGFRLDVNSLLAEQLPNPLEALAKMVGTDTLLRSLGSESTKQ